ncbi:Nucleolar protein 58 [Gryllus bimaculatus]|nr:Nucleolar protein 58 [Gryllus bimaculatus]
MLVLFETAAGYAIFKLLDEKKLAKTENLYHDFQTPETASKVVKLKHFEKFHDTTEALSATTAAVEGKVSKSLKKLLKNVVAKAEATEQLLVADPKLGLAIKEKLQLQCISNTAVQELMRCIRCQMDALLAGLPSKDLAAMALGLAHSLSRYKLKFSPDKVDTMIVQAVGLLDDLDKELNNYIMRTREWYGWHFPELGKILNDNVLYVKVIKVIGTRDHALEADLSDILSEEVEAQVKEAAEISMGTEIAEEDILNIQHLCDQVIEISGYRAQLFDYLRSRMMAITPNLTILVGELVGARLIAHAGSLINLAKHPASTVQILGAEKALFRALKSNKETPKYGLIYHSALVGQTSSKLKGKISRMLAAKAALATRVDALGEDVGIELGAEHKLKIERRISILEEGKLHRISGTGRSQARFEKHHTKSEVRQYGDAQDFAIPTKRKVEIEEVGSGEAGPSQPKKKRKTDIGEQVVVKEEIKEEEEDVTVPKKKKKKKSLGAEASETVVTEMETFEESPKKKKKKIKQEIEEEPEEVVSQLDESVGEKKKKKKKSLTAETEHGYEEAEEQIATPSSEKKKKKKRKSESME